MLQLVGAVAVFLFVVCGIELILNLGLFMGLLVWLLGAWLLSVLFKSLRRRIGNPDDVWRDERRSVPKELP